MRSTKGVGAAWSIKPVWGALHVRFVVFGWPGALGDWKAHRYVGDTRRPDHDTKAMNIAVPTTMLSVAVAASPVTSTLVSVIGVAC
jgi:hypothetical protein